MARPFPEYETFDATGLAALVVDGEAKPEELVETALDRIERRNPKLNAVVRVDADRAVAAASGPRGDGPFAGVPFLVKDLELVAGQRTTFGSVFFRDYVAETTSELVHRMDRAGLISLGRTNTPEFGLLPTTEPVLYGATANPWDLARSPGGSSGGAAAAVAAGIVPMAHGGDGGGSIRIPAANCGIFGLKASRGRLPQHPAAPSDMLALGGCLSRTVRDTAAFLDATAGPVPGARYAVADPEAPFAHALNADPGPLRVAVMREDFAGRPLHAECAAAMETTAHLLDELGHRVEDARPGIESDDVEDAFLVVWASLAASIFEIILEEASKKRRGRIARRVLGDQRTMKLITKLDERKSGLEAFEPFTVGLAERSARQTPAKLAMADTLLQTTSYRMAEFMESYDVLVTPTLGSPPVLTGEIDQTVDWGDLERRLRAYVPFTPVANFTGRPAMSVPLHWSEDGLPVGSHFVGAPGGEFALLRLAGQLERAQPWARRFPEIASA